MVVSVFVKSLCAVLTCQKSIGTTYKHQIATGFLVESHAGLSIHWFVVVMFLMSWFCRVKVCRWLFTYLLLLLSLSFWDSCCYVCLLSRKLKTQENRLGKKGRWWFLVLPPGTRFMIVWLLRYEPYAHDKRKEEKGAVPLHISLWRWFALVVWDFLLFSHAILILLDVPVLLTTCLVGWPPMIAAQSQCNHESRSSKAATMS